jgi:glycosyltransferase involved in cell wall biosynthesis
MEAGNVADRRYSGEPVFVFLGALNLPHNLSSIVHFIESQMDEITKKMPDARLRVIGKGASNELDKLAKTYGSALSVEGFVEDLDTVFADSCAMIVPLLFGSGLKIKMLEALSRGLPIISTDFGVEGIPVTSGVNCLVENDIDQYPQAMSTLTDVSYNSAISHEARKLYSENYSREVVLREYDLLFGKTAAR